MGITAAPPPLLFFSGFGASSVVVGTPDSDGVHHGASRGRKRYAWEEDRFYLPPHTKKPTPEDDPLPHEAALVDAKHDLAEARRLRVAPQAELRALSARMGGLTKTARRIERRIAVAEDAVEISIMYRALGEKLRAYVVELDALQEKRRQRMRKDEAAVLQILMQLD